MEYIDLEIPFNEYFKNIGLPFKVILKKISIKKNLNKIEKVYREESIKQFNKIKLYSEIHETLRKLKKKQIIVGVVTSKDRIRTIKLKRNNVIKNLTGEEIGKSIGK